MEWKVGTKIQVRVTRFKGKASIRYSPLSGRNDKVEVKEAILGPREVSPESVCMCIKGREKESSRRVNEDEERKNTTARAVLSK